MKVLVKAIVLGLGLIASPALAGDWERIADEDGIQVWQRETPGSSFVEFRGRGVVDASILDVAAVLRDASREIEWMESCSASYIVSYATPFDVVNYNRTASPFFLIDDRDVVLETHTIVAPKDGSITVKFRTTRDTRVPERDGVVRMPKVDGHWIIAKVDDTKTWVEYQIAADPGGSLPAWVVNWASKSLPFETIQGLRKQVRAPGYDKQREILSLGIDFDALPARSKATQGG